MKRIAFASGKGGAGKTSLSLSFHAYMHSRSVFVDCDVDAADAFLLLEREKTSHTEFASGLKYTINAGQCVQCGACAERCVFHAISPEGGYHIEPLHCEGCGACRDVCPAEAVVETPNRCGDMYSATTCYDSSMWYARLIPGEDNSGKLVHDIRKKAQEYTEKEGIPYLIIDCPPGIGCPLMASITAVDLLVVVIESSRSGFHDAQRLIELARKMNISCVALINKADINPDIDKEINEYLIGNAIHSVGTIPFNRAFTALLNKKRVVYEDEAMALALTPIFSAIEQIALQGGEK